jgi:anti-sigma regulatory factor (Ser/Thr protein kinase)
VLAWFAPPAGSSPRGSVELEPIRSFLRTGQPVLGEDPRSTRRKPFSAAVLDLGGRTGYVYVILGGERYDRFLGSIRESYYLRAGLASFLLAIAATLLAGFAIFFLLTRRLASLAQAVKAFERGELGLIENALRFTPAGGEVRVALAAEAGGTRVSVSDTGSGIAPEDLPHVFERFYRADRSRARSTGGAGLGLAIARQIAELHGSRLEVESSPGRGSLFHFLLA